MTADARQSVLSSGPINGRSFAGRAAGLTRSERACYRRILEHFIAGGPSVPYSPRGEEVAPLIEADLVQAADDGRIVVAYPFAAQPTRHRVTLHDGRGYTRCARSTHSQSPICSTSAARSKRGNPTVRGIVRVAVDPDGEPTWTPRQAVAVAWERTLRRVQGRDDLGGGYLLHGGSSCPLGLGLRPERSTAERTGREDRRSKFYEVADNLSSVSPVDLPSRSPCRDVSPPIDARSRDL